MLAMQREPNTGYREPRSFCRVRAESQKWAKREEGILFLDLVMTDRIEKTYANIALNRKQGTSKAERTLAPKEL